LNTPPDWDWYQSKANKTDFNLYTKVHYSLNQSVSVFGDIQLRKIGYSIEGIDDDTRDITQHHPFTFVNPKAGLFYRINSLNSAYLSVAAAHREPNRDNFVDADPGKPSPSPERLIDLEAGHHLKNSIIALNTNIYCMVYKDQLALTGAINDVGAPVMVNVPDSYRIGIELSAKVSPVKKVNWTGSLTLSRNKVVEFTEYVDNWDTWGQEAILHRNTDLAFSPSLLANSELTFNVIPQSSITLISRYVGKQYLDNSQDESRILKPYFVNDLRMSGSIRSKLFNDITLRLSLNNLFNVRYESNAWVYRYVESGSYKVMDGYFPQAGFHIMGGISVKI
jgi:iron complex outermembrane receptor protein